MKTFVPISSDHIVGPVPWSNENLPPSAQTLPELLEYFAQIQPSHPALVSGSSHLDYQEFSSKARTFSAGLASIGARKGTRVAILAPNIEEWMVATFAALRFGSGVELFNTWVLAWDFEYLLEVSKAEILITVPKVRSTDLLGELKKIIPDFWERGEAKTGRAEKFPHLQEIIIIGDDFSETKPPLKAKSFDQVFELGRDKPVPDNYAEPKGTAYIMYTSGTTERPKAVPLKHREMIENGFAIGSRMGLTNKDRVWLNSPLFWSFGGANAAVATMSNGATLILHEIFTPKSTAQALADEKCTAAYLLPSAIAALVGEVAEEIRAIDSLRTGLTIGRPEEVKKAIVDLGITQMCNVYGSTEVYGNCCVTPHDMELEERLICQGPPLEGVSFRIVDQETNSVLPLNTPGELQVKGRMMSGYIGDVAATQSVITNDGWYRTGDTGILRDNGTFQFIARHSEMIKTSGINVSPLEVEGFLSTHSSVSEVVVVGALHPLRGEVPVAFVVTDKKSNISGEDLKQYCRDSIASFKVPWAVVLIDQLPKTTTGKIMRKVLIPDANKIVENLIADGKS